MVGLVDRDIGKGARTGAVSVWVDVVRAADIVIMSFRLVELLGFEPDAERRVSKGHRH